jgi:hypothetical protein
MVVLTSSWPRSTWKVSKHYPFVGPEEVDDGVWDLYFGPLKLGRLLEKHMRIEDAFGRLKRQLLPMSPDSFVTYLPDRS